MILKTLISLSFILIICSCTSRNLGSVPINHLEKQKYIEEKARCYKVGGKRVIKIKGQLQCFNY